MIFNSISFKGCPFSVIILYKASKNSNKFLTEVGFKFPFNFIPITFNIISRLSKYVITLTFFSNCSFISFKAVTCFLKSSQKIFLLNSSLNKFLHISFIFALYVESLTIYSKENLNFKSFSILLFLFGITFILVQKTSSFFELFLSDFLLRIKLFERAFNFPKLPKVFFPEDSLLLLLFFFSLLFDKLLLLLFKLFSLFIFVLDFVGVSFWAEDSLELSKVFFLLKLFIVL